MKPALFSLFLLAPSLFAEFKDTPSKHLDIYHQDKPLVRYVYEHDMSTDETRHNTYKVWHHILDREGKEITKGPQGKFPHHRAIYIGWSKLEFQGEKHDLWHMKNQAVQKHEKFLKQESDENKSILSTQIAWMAKDGKTKLLEEVRTVTIHHNATDAYVLLDFESELKAINGDVNLKGDPEHAGFQFRPHNDVVSNKSATYTYHEPNIDIKKSKDAPWVAMNFKLRGQSYTVQHMNHSSNPKGTRYSAYRDYGRFGAFFETPIKNGESLKLKYRLKITEGETPSFDQLTSNYSDFK